MCLLANRLFQDSRTCGCPSSWLFTLVLAAGPEIANCQFSVFVLFSSQQCLTQIITPSMGHAITQLLGFHTLSPLPMAIASQSPSLDPSSFPFSRQWYIQSNHPTDRISPKERAHRVEKKSHWETCPLP